MTSARFTWAAASIVAVATAALAAMGWGGFYYQDDFLFLRQGRDATLTLSYLGEGAFGHFFPGFRAVFWLQDRTWGLNHDVAVIIVAVLHLATLAAMLRLLVLLFGRGTGTLVLLGMFAFSGLWLAPYLWWVSALQVLPAMLMSILAIDAYVRYVLDRRPRHALLAAAAFAASLVFYEKPAQLLALLPLLTILAFSTSWSVRAWVRELAALWRVWAAFAVVLVVYAALYVTGDFFVETTRPSVSTWLETVSEGWHQGFVPALLGGSVDYQWNGSLGFTDPSPLLTVVQQLVVVAAVALTVWRSPPAWRGWLFVAVAFAINVGVIAYSRSGQFGPNVGRELKYLIDILPFAIIGIGLAFLPLRAGPRRDAMRDARPLPAGAVRVALPLGALAFLAAFAVSGVRFADNWHDGESAQFARNFKAAAEREGPAKPSTVFFDGAVNDGILSSIFQPFQRHSVLLALFDRTYRYAGQATRTLAVQADGSISAHRVVAQTELRVDALMVDGRPYDPPGGGSICTPKDRAPHLVSLPLTVPLPDGRPYVRLVARAPDGATVSFTQQAGIGTGATDPAKRVSALRLDRSRRPLYVPLDAPGAGTVDILVAAPGRVCFERGFAGPVAPRPVEGV